jgi:predicted nucleotidyltransferase
MANRPQLNVRKEKIEEFCKKHGIRKLSVFGSFFRKNFGLDSNLDILVEFEPGRKWDS